MRRVLSLSPLLVLPALISQVVASSPTFPNGTERDENGTDVDADDSKRKSAFLEKFCTAQLNSFVATYQSTEIATSRWTWYEGFGPTDSLGDLTGSVTSQTYWTSTFLCKCHKDRINTLYFLPTCFIPSPRIAVRKPHSRFAFLSVLFMLSSTFCRQVPLSGLGSTCLWPDLSVKPRPKMYTAWC